MANEPGRLPTLSQPSPHPYATPSNARSSSRLNEVVNRCFSLKQDIGCTLKDLQTDRTRGMLILTESHKDLDSPFHTRWQSSAKYKEVKERIRQKEREYHFTALESLYSQRETRLRRSRLATQKPQPANSHKRISSRMVGAFLLTDWLTKPRDFGATAVATQSNAEQKEMDQFWRDEIEKYEKKRIERKLKLATSRKDERSAAVTRTLESKQTLSPLQLYVFENTKRRLGEDQHFAYQQLRTEAKMNLIQPSAEVQALSVKYLPRALQADGRKPQQLSPPLFALFKATRTHRKKASL